MLLESSDEGLDRKTKKEKTRGDLTWKDEDILTKTGYRPL